MIALEEGRVIKITNDHHDLQELLVEIAGQGVKKAINYPDLTGIVLEADQVRLNTTAVRLGLGSGGFHLVTAILERSVEQAPSGSGHIMKLRYTPSQLQVLAVEEEGSPHRTAMLAADDIQGMVVLAATLHSQLAPLACLLGGRGIRTAYLMTDGAALPLAYSNTVRQLKEQQLLVGTITIGHAFGGDLEAVNIYSGLLAARHVLKAEVVIVAMGPGIVGTGTRWGFTGIEQGQVINAAAALGGCPVLVPRISFADQRERHRGLSHHTLTVLERVCQVPCLLPLPLLTPVQQGMIEGQLTAAVTKRHQIVWIDGSPVLASIPSSIVLSTMGRSSAEETEFFLACGAAGVAASAIINGELTFTPPPVN
ncbi:MAG: DUF3866 family protein [Methylocystaceae bacterium]